MVLLRRLLGEALRKERQAQRRTLREVSSAARVSLGYLSEVERGQKEASSELLFAICEALDVPLSELLRGVSEELSLAEAAGVGSGVPAKVPVAVAAAVASTPGFSRARPAAPPVVMVAA
jgi:transcriptional regulator with XRE-family HTH domain